MILSEAQRPAAQQQNYAWDDCLKHGYVRFKQDSLEFFVFPETVLVAASGLSRVAGYGASYMNLQPRESPVGRRVKYVRDYPRTRWQGFGPRRVDRVCFDVRDLHVLASLLKRASTQDFHRIQAVASAFAQPVREAAPTPTLVAVVPKLNPKETPVFGTITYRQTHVRYFVVNGEVLFVASDVAEAAGYSRTYMTSMRRNVETFEKHMRQHVHEQGELRSTFFVVSYRDMVALRSRMTRLDQQLMTWLKEQAISLTAPVTETPVAPVQKASEPTPAPEAAPATLAVAEAVVPAQAPSAPAPAPEAKTGQLVVSAYGGQPFEFVVFPDDTAPGVVASSLMPLLGYAPSYMTSNASKGGNRAEHLMRRCKAGNEHHPTRPRIYVACHEVFALYELLGEPDAAFQAWLHAALKALDEGGLPVADTAGVIPEPRYGRKTRRASATSPMPVAEPAPVSTQAEPVSLWGRVLSFFGFKRAA